MSALNRDDDDGLSVRQAVVPAPPAASPPAKL
jgi:hypothetical protein